MKRSEPPRRKKPLAPSDKPLKRTGRLTPVQPLQRYRELKPRPARDAHAAAKFRLVVIDRARGRCQVCPILAASDNPGAIDVARRCDGIAQQAHHLQPRGMGGHGDNDPDNGIAACERSHAYIEANRAFAYEAGLLKRHTT